MVVSIGHFDTDQDEFVIEGRLHNGAAVPGSSDDWEQWVTQFRGAPHDIDREYHRIEHQSQLDRQIIDRPAAHPRDEYSLMMKMKTPYQMASIRPPISEYETLKTIAADASPLTLPPQNELESNPVSLRRYSGPSDGQPLSFVIIYETGHVAVHARENCAYEGQYQFTISDEASQISLSAYTNPNLDHSAIPTSVRKTPSLQRHLDSVWELTNSGSMHTRTPHRTHSLQLTTRSVLRVESIYSKQETTRRSRVP